MSLKTEIVTQLFGPLILCTLDQLVQIIVMDMVHVWTLDQIRDQNVFVTKDTKVGPFLMF